MASFGAEVQKCRVLWLWNESALLVPDDPVQIVDAAETPDRAVEFVILEEYSEHTEAHVAEDHNDAEHLVHLPAEHGNGEYEHYEHSKQHANATHQTFGCHSHKRRRIRRERLGCEVQQPGNGETECGYQGWLAYLWRSANESLSFINFDFIWTC